MIVVVCFIVVCMILVVYIYIYCLGESIHIDLFGCVFDGELSPLFTHFEATFVSSEQVKSGVTLSEKSVVTK